jgi:long-chain acyl-CoA synthetase
VTVDETATEGWTTAQIEEAVAAAVEEVNRERARYEQIKRFRILPRDFSAEHDEVTPTLKLRRKVILEHFAAEVEALYAEVSATVA